MARIRAIRRAKPRRVPPRDLDFVERWLKFLWLRSWFSSEHTKRVGVEDERDNDLAGSERVSFERGVTRVGEHVPAVGTPDAGTVMAEK